MPALAAVLVFALAARPLPARQAPSPGAAAPAPPSDPAASPGPPSLPLGANPQDAVAPLAPNFVSELWSRVPVASAAVFQDDTALAARTLDLYDFDPDPAHWQVRELRAPELNKYFIFHLDHNEDQAFIVNGNDAIQATGPPDAFVAVVARDGPPALAVIPLCHDGLKYNAWADPHNLAVFNDLMTGEGPPGSKPAVWVDLARDYLEMTGDATQVIDSSNVKETLGSVSITGLAPVVLVQSDGMVRVQFNDFHGSDHIWIWQFELDSQGLIRAVGRHEVDKAGLLRLRQKP